MSSPRRQSLSGRLARLGFTDTVRAERLLTGHQIDDVLLDAIGATADPDFALTGLLGLLEATDDDGAGILAELRGDPGARDRLLAVLGVSAAFGDQLGRHPDHWRVLVGPEATARPDPDDLRADLLRAVGADPADPAPFASGPDTAIALRLAYRKALLHLAARDLTQVVNVEEVAAELADLAAAALEAGLAIARTEVGPEARNCRLAVIGMGKCGGRELNYVSDVDVVFVAESISRAPHSRVPDDSERSESSGTIRGSAGTDPQESMARRSVGGDAGADPQEVTARRSVEGDPREVTVRRSAGADPQETTVLRTATRLAAAMMRACSASTPEGALWEVDASLRPEGKAGPLVRTLASHRAYYERWAKTWEFQALLKARPVAGDRALGEAYVEALAPLVWHASERDHFVEDVQAMRRRVEAHIDPDEADRQLKLGPGGLRDVEFAVQLLQLVHGRADTELRGPNTLIALNKLSWGGYVGRGDAATLGAAYRFLRRVEHLIQLYRLRRTHLVPDDPAGLRRLGRALGMRAYPVRDFTAEWQRHAREVRRLHEKLFYRPLLSAVARLPSDETRLTRDAARARLEALGYLDPPGALRHLEALTNGVSRRAAIQRTLLPVMLGWFADGPDPDAGLLGFREVSDALGTTPWYLRLLRDEVTVAERMAWVLSASRYATDLLLRAPEAVAMLAGVPDRRNPPARGVTGSLFRDRAALMAEALAAVGRGGTPEQAAIAIRGLRRKELFRVAATDLLGGADAEAVGRALTDIAVVTIEAALAAATAHIELELRHPLPTRIAIVAMGRLGGHELGYGSDADVMFVHDPLPGADEREAASAAHAVAEELRRLLALPAPDPPLVIDPGLRPEGRQGPLVRTLDSYAAYYRRWSAPWESQALLRADPSIGDPELGRRFGELIDPIRRPVGGIDEAVVRDIRRLKARMEAERLPRGADPTTHLKLGPGGLSDVEWVVQLLQLEHAHHLPELATTQTLVALDAATRHGLIAEADAEVLAEAWQLASRIRNAIVLVRGRPSDNIPSDLSDQTAVARVLGLDRAGDLLEDYRRRARRARSVVEEVFYGGR